MLSQVPQITVTGVLPTDTVLKNREVLVANLPPHIRNTLSISKMFYPYGDIKVELISPSARPVGTKSIPKIVKMVIEEHQSLNRDNCAIVTFETARSAKFAIHMMRKRQPNIPCLIIKESLVGEMRRFFEGKDPISSSDEENTPKRQKLTVWNKVKKSKPVRDPYGPVLGSRGFKLVRHF